MSTAAPLSLGIDIGGTFTDLVIHDPRDGRAVIWKESTTPDDPAVGAALAGGIAARHAAGGDRLNIICCENWRKPAEVLREALAAQLGDEDRTYLAERVGIAEATVLRVAEMYRVRRVAVVTLIASKPIENVRAFSDAFRIRRRKEED